MFGIGLPELILIMGIALIVVGPEKLPEMARSIARVVLDLKQNVASLKESLEESMSEVPRLEEVAGEGGAPADSPQTHDTPPSAESGKQPPLAAVAGPAHAEEPGEAAKG